MKKIIFITLVMICIFSSISFADKTERTPSTDLFCSDMTETCQKILYSGQMNYLVNGSYIPINTTIETSKVSGFVYEMTNAPYKAYFKNNTNNAEAVTFWKDNFFFTYDLSGGKIQWRATPTQPSVTDTLGGGANSNSQNTIAKINSTDKSVYYEGAFHNTTVNYFLYNTMLKETFTLTGLPSFKDYLYLEYTGNIKFNKTLDICNETQCFTPSGTQDDFETSGRIYFKFKNETIFFLEAPTVTDANETTIPALYSVHGSNAQMNFWLRINQTFLKNAVYPIVIDPTIILQTADTEILDDVYVDNESGVEDNNFNGPYARAYLLLESDTTRWRRIYLKANTTSLAGLTLFTANLSLFYSGSSTSADGSGAIYHVYNHSWDEDVITWIDQPCDTTLNPIKCNSTYEDNISLPFVSSTWRTWNILNMLQSDINAGYLNTSFLIKTWNESLNNGGWWHESKESPSTSYRPKIVITYGYDVPYWRDNKTYMPSNYSSSTLSIFNLTWEGNTIDKVLIENNFSGTPSNSTMTRISGNNISGVYNYNLTLGVGSYYWKSYANDTDDEWNTSTRWNFTISKNTPTLSLTGSNSTYPTNISVIASESNSGDVGSIYRLWRNSTNTQNGSSLTDFTKYGANIYLFNYSTDGNANYSSNYATLLIKVTQGTPTPSAEVESSTSDVGFPRYSILNLTGSSNVDYSMNHTLSLNMTGAGDNFTWNSGTSVTNATNFTINGVFLLNATTWGDANWSTASDTVYITISGTTSSPAYSNMKTSQTSPVEYNPAITHQFNITWTDDDGMSEVFLEFNNINYTVSNSSNEYYYTLPAKSLNVNNYTYRWFANDSIDVWTKTSFYYYNQSKNSTNPFLVNMTKGPTSYYNSDVSGTSSDEIKISATMNYTDSGTLKIYFDGTEISNGYSNTFGVGTHTIIVNTSGNANYSISTVSYYITISLPTGGSGGSSDFVETYVTGNWSLQRTDALFTMSPGSSLTNFITVVNKKGDEISGITIECPTESDDYDLCKYVTLEEVAISESVYQLSTFRLEGGKTANLGYTINIPSNANLSTFKTYDFVLMVTAEGVSQPFTVSVFYVPGGEELAGFLTFFSDSTLGIPNWLIIVGTIVLLIVAVLIAFGRHKKNRIRNLYNLIKS